MTRLTVVLNAQDHYALKLFSLHANKKMKAIVQDAIRAYLASAGAYGLKIGENDAFPDVASDDLE